MKKTKLIIILLSTIMLGAACTPGSIKTGDPDGGVWVSLSKGENWEQRARIYEDRVTKKTMGNTDISKLVFSPKDERKIFAVTYNNGLWVSWNEGHNWDLILANTRVFDMAIHPNNPRKIYAATAGSIVLTEDEGVRWRSTYTSDDPAENIVSIVLNPTKPSTIYASTNKGNLIVSDDNGISWRSRASLGALVVLRDLRFHPNQENEIYAIADNEGLARSADAGENWDFFKEEFSKFSGTSDPKDYALIPSGIVYASKFGILRSLNFGKDWMPLPLISGDRGDNIYSLAVHPSDPLEIFYGTRSTLYHSVDGGFNWIPRALPTTRSASELAIHPNLPGVIYMGTSRLTR